MNRRQAEREARLAIRIKREQEAERTKLIKANAAPSAPARREIQERSRRIKQLLRQADRLLQQSDHERRVRAHEDAGMTRSDAQAAVAAEAIMKGQQS